MYNAYVDNEHLWVEKYDCRVNCVIEEYLGNSVKLCTGWYLDKPLVGNTMQLSKSLVNRDDKQVNILIIPRYIYIRDIIWI
jgi:hypothetical protein